MGKCHVKSQWFEKSDENGFEIKLWAVKVDDYHVKCIFCKSVFRVVKGFDGITQHAKGSTHRKLCEINLNPNQLKLGAGEHSINNTSEGETLVGTPPTLPALQQYNVRDKATDTELLWVLKCVVSDYSQKSCEGIVHLFQRMFGNVAVSGVSLCRTKVRYLLSEALGPHFKALLLEDMGGATYSLSYDETTNAANFKELQIGVTYWSEKKSVIVNHHLESFFIGSATGEVLAKKINEAVDNASLPLTKLVMLSRDGPFVNDKVERLINQQLIAIRKTSLVNIGSCNIHILHNGFLAGLKMFGEDVSDLALKSYYFLHQWPLRKEDLRDIQRKLALPEHNFVKHVTNRWLTLEEAADRLVEQWPALREYFLVFIPKHRSKLQGSNHYKEIVQLLKQDDMLAQIKFVSASAKIFTRFTRAFQSSEPMIHLMHDELSRLANTLLGRVCKPSALSDLGICEAALDSKHLIPASRLAMDDVVVAEISKWKDERKELEFRSKVQKHLVAACRHVIKKSAILNPVVESCRFLHPEKMKLPKSLAAITTLGRAMPFPVDIPLLQDEWRLLQLEEDISPKDRIESFWAQFFALKTSLGDLKYPTTASVVKSAFTLAHGNAEIERGFSSSARFLTEDKARMSVRTLNAAMMVKSGMKAFDMKPECVPIPKSLRCLAFSAHSSYTAYCEEQKLLKEREVQNEKEKEENTLAQEAVMRQVLEEKKKISEEEEKLKELKKNEAAKRKTEYKLLSEANKRLKVALEKNDLTEAGVAKAMLDGVEKTRKARQSQANKVEEVQTLLNKRQSSIVTKFVKSRNLSKPKR